MSHNIETMALIPGFAGDLVPRKLIPAFRRLQLKRRKAGLPLKLQVLGLDLQDIGDSFLDRVGRRQNIDLGSDSWSEFKKMFDYVNYAAENGRGVDEAKFDELVVPRIRKFLTEKCSNVSDTEGAEKRGVFLVYLALPYQANESFIRLFVKALKGLSDYGKSIYVVFEKPMELDVDRIDTIVGLLTAAGIPEENTGIVEHFAMKPGLRQLLGFLYHDEVRRSAFNSEMVERIVIKVQETLGTENRAYPGTGVDSFLNHMMFYLGCLLGDPHDEVDQTVGHTVTKYLKRMLPKLRRTKTDEEASDVRDDFNEKLRPHGAYAVCRQDHGAPHEEFATAAIFSFYPASNRWKGDTQFVIIHEKNSPRKNAQVEVYFRKGKTRWRITIDGYHFGERVWGWTRISYKVRPEDPSKLDPVIEPRYEPVPSELTDGYPEVVERACLGDLSHLMPIEYQKTTLRVMMPLLKQLDEWDPESNQPRLSRVYYDKGVSPFFEWEEMWDKRKEPPKDGDRERIHRLY